jgi:hypothetical protein
MNKIFDQYYSKGVDLKHMGLNEIAWPYPICLEVINSLKDSNFLILGGDALKAQSDQFNHTGDSWYLDESEMNNSVEYSAEKGIQYIERYVQNNGNLFCFVLTVKQNV